MRPLNFLPTPGGMLNGRIFSVTNYIPPKKDKNSKMLIAMTTGTGKTFTLVIQIHRLMKSGVARRVLFFGEKNVCAVGDFIRTIWRFSDAVVWFVSAVERCAFAVERYVYIWAFVVAFL